jgi:hypothetical protein
VRAPLWFSWSCGFSTFTVLQNYPQIVRMRFARKAEFDDLAVHGYLLVKLPYNADREAVEAKFKKLFVLLSIYLMSLSAFSMVHFQLFKVHQLPYSGAQLFSLLSASISGISMIQNLLCSAALSWLIKQQKRQVALLEDQELAQITV